MITMFVSPSKLWLLTRRFAASVLLLWLAGVGCMLGCEMHVAAAPKTAPVVTTENESCPTTASGHSCCKEVGGSETTIKGRTSYLGVRHGVTNESCCQPTAVIADPASKLSPKGKLLAVANNGIPVALNSRVSISVPSTKLRVPDRGSTHLRCCVFLM